MSNKMELRAQLEAEWIAQSEWNDFTNWLINVKIPQLASPAPRSEEETEKIISELLWYLKASHPDWKNTEVFKRAEGWLARAREGRKG